MWTCPQCQQKFAYRNQWHSCGEFSEAAFLEGKTPEAIDLYHHFIDTYRQLGDFQLHPVKTRVSLMVKMRFASVNSLGKNFLNGHLVLRRAYPETLCFHKIQSFSKNQHVHHFRLESKADLTHELQSYMREACEECGTRKWTE